MTAATLTRTARSAYPTALDGLIPLARDYAAELDATPTRNQLMKRFRVGAPKAKALLAALAPAPAETAPPQLPIVMVEDEAYKFFSPPPTAPATAPSEPDPTETAPPLVITDTRGPEFAEFGNLFRPASEPASVPDAADTPPDQPAPPAAAPAARSRVSR
jgi:hypothetical protein